MARRCSAGCAVPSEEDGIVEPELEVEEQTASFGADGRIEYFAASSTLQTLAQSTVALMNSSRLTDNGGWNISATPTFNAKLLADPSFLAPLHSSEPFRTQPAPGNCFGFMVGPDTIATAGHSISEASCSPTRFIFDFRMNSATTVNSTVGYDNVYNCQEVVFRALGPAIAPLFTSIAPL